MFLSIVIPALNEELTITKVIEKAFKGMRQSGVDGEVIVADNGSTDQTPILARNAGAKVITVTQKGYGSAIQGGCAVAQGDYIIFADADDTYDFEQIGSFIDKLKEGYEFVIGNRYKGPTIPGSMPFSHRYLGTPVLTFVVNLFFKTNIGDVNCGMRALKKEAFKRMDCRCPGMEFASEMIARASLMGLEIIEVPCTLYPALKGRKAHLKAWRDGFRHLYLLCSMALKNRSILL